jgi:hypothetical protein
LGTAAVVTVAAVAAVAVVVTVAVVISFHGCPHGSRHASKSTLLTVIIFFVFRRR